MNRQVKKKLFAILPYVLIFLLGAKLGQGFRLSPGMDVGTRILCISDGMKMAFASLSFQSIDLLVGGIIALFFRMAVY